MELLLLFLLLLLRLHLLLLILLLLDPHLSCSSLFSSAAVSLQSLSVFCSHPPLLQKYSCSNKVHSLFSSPSSFHLLPSLTLLLLPLQIPKSPNPQILQFLQFPFLPPPPLPPFSPPHPLSHMIVQTSQNTPNTQRGTQGQFLPPLLGIRCPPLPGPRLLPLIETPSLPPPSSSSHLSVTCPGWPAR